MTRNPESFLPLQHPVVYILVALLGEVKHGYAIMAEINQRVGTGIGIAPASLYRCLKHLCDSGLIKEVDGPFISEDVDSRRKHYVITELGESVLKAEQQRLLSILVLMENKMRLPRIMT